MRWVDVERWTSESFLKAFLEPKCVSLGQTADKLSRRPEATGPESVYVDGWNRDQLWCHMSHTSLGRERSLNVRHLVQSPSSS